MMQTIITSSYILLVWALLFGVFSGIGLLIQSLFRSHPDSIDSSFDDYIDAFWIGFALSIAVLQVWHLFLPVQFGAFAACLLIGIAGWIRHRHAVSTIITRLTQPRLLRRLLPVIGVVVIVGLWVAYFALHTALNYDDGLYHLQDLKWVEQYPILPGLGNIHGRLAFNNALNLWLAMLNQTPLLPPVQYIGGGLLAGVFILQLLWNVWQIVRQPNTPLQSSLYRYFLALHLPVVLFVAQSPHSPNLSSLKNDFPVSILTILLAANVLKAMGQTSQRAGSILTAFAAQSLSNSGNNFPARAKGWFVPVRPLASLFPWTVSYSAVSPLSPFTGKEGQGEIGVKPIFATNSTSTLLTSTLLVCAAVSIKLSAAAAGACLLLALLIILIRQQPGKARRLIALTGITVTLIGGIWLMRGAILSGYPLYPSSLIALPVDWRINPQVAITEATGIQSWARIPGGDPAVVLADWQWLSTWWAANRTRTLELITPLLVITVSLLLILHCIIQRRSLAGFRASGGWFLLPLLPGLLLWFFYAPDLRFGWQNLWMIAVWLLILGVRTLPGRPDQRLRPVTLLLVGGLSATVLLTPAQPSAVTIGEQHPYPDAPTQNFYTYHGLKLNVPVNDPRCWDAALPCTPYPDYEVALRQPGDLSQGFKRVAIEPDKGAFALAEILPDPTIATDIVPVEAVQQIKVGQLPVNGLLVGHHGWQGLEDWGTGRQRWVDNLAQLYVTQPDASLKRLALTVTSGPSLNNQPFRLFLLNEHYVPVGSALIGADETRAIFDLRLNDERVQLYYLFCLCIKNPAPGDGRVLNFRVTDIRWQALPLEPLAALQQLLVGFKGVD